MIESQWVQAAQKGDKDAFGQLVEKYSVFCFAISFRIHKNYDAANDSVQEAWISIFQYIKKFKNSSKFSTWIYRIVYNQALKDAKINVFFEEIDYSQEVNIEDDEIIAENNEKNLSMALSILDKKERLCIDLFYYQEQSIADIAFITSISTANIKVILHRARKKMKNYLQSTNFATNE